jgi:Flp pilus assembly protein TadG
MRARLLRLRRDDRGLSMIFVGLGCMAFVAASTLAIDVGMFMTARTQAQNSADAGALAGATALAFDSFTDRTAAGPAVQCARSAAGANTVRAGRRCDVPGGSGGQ